MDYYHKEFRFVESQLNRLLGDAECQPPRNLLIFINVNSGNGDGLDIFIQSVRPYFEIAKITYDIVAIVPANSPSSISCEPSVVQEALGCANFYILTERISEFLATLEQTDFDKYSAFIAIGGDGTFSELTTGCVKAAQRGVEGQMTLIAPDSELKPFSKPIGIISGGSTDAAACTYFGSRDPHIAAIGIALGCFQQVDVAAIFSDGIFCRIASCAIHCGFGTELLKIVENYRHFGPLKNLIGFFGSIARFPPVYAHLEYRMKEQSSREFIPQQTCTRRCIACQQYSLLSINRPKNAALASPRSNWLQVADVQQNDDPLCAVIATVSPLRIPGVLKHGMTPLCHVRDGAAQIFLTHYRSGRVGLLSNYLALLRGNIGAVYYKQSPLVDLITLQNCCEYRFTARSSSPHVSRGLLDSITWNVDGELVEAHELRGVVHSGLFRVFGFGGPLPSPPFLSSLYWQRWAKLFVPSAVLRPSPLKKPPLPVRIFRKVDAQWRGSALDSMLASFLGDTLHVYTAPTTRLCIFCSLFAIIVFILLVSTMWISSLHDDTSSSDMEVGGA